MPVAAEEVLPVEASFQNGLVAFLSFEERSQRVSRAACWWVQRFPGLGGLCPAPFVSVFSETLVWCVYGGKEGALPTDSKADEKGRG